MDGIFNGPSFAKMSRLQGVRRSRRWTALHPLWPAIISPVVADAKSGGSVAVFSFRLYLK
jgi:hypothetical protein